MVDKFGGYGRRLRGPPGPPGRDAFNIFNWSPFSALRMFRENTSCTFYFNTADDGIVYDEDKKPVGLKDRCSEIRWKSNVRNALCLQNFQKPIILKSRYYTLPLKKSLYKISKLPSVTLDPWSIMITVFSFKVSAPLTKEEDFIFTNKSSTRGVTISKKSINILGSEARLELEYAKNEWNTMFLQYSYLAGQGEDKCIFSLNGRRGSFHIKDVDFGEDNDLYIGGHPEKRNFTDIVLGNFEVYTRSNFDGPVPPSQYLVSDKLIDMLEDDMDQRVR